MRGELVGIVASATAPERTFCVWNGARAPSARSVAARVWLRRSGPG